MKHLILSLLTLNSSLLTLSAAVPIRWTVETSRATPAQFEAYQGETLALEAALQSYGKPLEAPSNYSLYWQTNGMGNAYWSTPCTVPASSLAGASNVLFATWSPTNDVGAKVYNCFIGQPGTIYHAAFQLRLRPSPGETPNELPLPQKVIDFAKVTVLNPPWSGGGGGGVDTNAVIDIANATIATNPVVVAKLDGPTFAPTNTADASGKAADAKLTGVALTNRYTKAETDAKLSPIAAQLAQKRDKTDGDFTGTTIHGGIEDIADGFNLRNDGISGYLDLGWDTGMELIRLNGEYDDVRVDIGQSYDGMAGTLNVKGGSFDHPHQTTITSTSIKKDGKEVRVEEDNTCHKTEFTEWTCDVEGYDVLEYQNPYDPSTWYYNLTKDGVSPSGQTKESQTRLLSVTLRDWDTDEAPLVTATRSAVCTDGEKFTTSDVVDGKVSAAVSTNNPEFVSAVRNTPTSGIPDDMPTDWGTYGTVGAALAALAAFVKWAKAKIVAVIGSDGKPTDTFATDLLGKPVAINALHYALYSVPTTGADANKLKDRAVNAFTFSGGSLPTFPAQVAGCARDFLLDVTATADGSNITIPEPDGSTATSIGDALAFTAGKTYLVAITEIAAKHYYIRVIDTTPANAA